MQLCCIYIWREAISNIYHYFDGEDLGVAPPCLRTCRRTPGRAIRFNGPRTCPFGLRYYR